MKKLGFFGGCFNPPTYAHINLAEKVIKEYGLDKVIFVPVGDYYKKENLLEAKHRFFMLQEACTDKKYLEVSDLELKLKTELKAIDVFKIIQNLYPQEEVYYIIGSDNLEKMPTWKDAEELVQNYKYIVLDRQEKATEKLMDTNNLLQQNKHNFYGIQSSDTYMISSTLVRNKIQKEQNVEGLIPNKVYAYIQKNNLYKGEKICM